MAGLGRAAAERLVTPVLSARTLAAVALGGALGGVLRYLLGELAPDGTGFPWTTFAINVTGAAALALLPHLPAVRRHALLTVGLGPGLLGGYTTLSTASEQTRALLADRPVLALAYAVGTLLACLAAVAVVRRAVTPAEVATFDREGGDA